MSILHSCRDCEQWPDCPYADADQCPKLREELRGVDRPRHKREQPFGYLNGFADTDAARPVATRLVDARAAGQRAVMDLAIRRLKQDGFTGREIEALCRSGWGQTTIRKA